MQNGLRFTKLFSSDLHRAVKTAEAIRLAQIKRPEVVVEENLEITQLVVLREQDFGFYEGKPFFARPRNSNKLGKETHRSQHVDDPEFRDVESKESMKSRMDDFLNDHLVPLVRDDRAGKEETIAIVSHGIILSHLWRSLLKLIGKGRVTLAPGISADSGRVTPLEYLGGWSNTGYLELDIQITWPAETSTNDQLSLTAAAAEPQPARSEDPSLPALGILVKTINGREHMKGLKRTRGVGSSKYDEGQQKIETFFKKTKVGESNNLFHLLP